MTKSAISRISKISSRVNKRERVIQTVLRHSSGSGFTYVTTWLPRDKRVRVGTVLTLKDDPKQIKWTVFKQGTEIEARLINRRWNVGGLE